MLHTCRLYSIFANNKRAYLQKLYFYNEWDLLSSILLIECDKELQQLILEINKTEEKPIYVKPIIEHYEINDAFELTKKISSICSLQSMMVPMQYKDKVYVADLTNRYFTEDLHYGLKYIINLCDKYKIKAPMCHGVYNGLMLLYK